MAKRDWAALAVRYKKEAEVTGITVKDFCKLHSLPINSARRYIKPLNHPSHAKIGTDQSGHSDHAAINGQTFGLSDVAETQNQQFTTLESLGSEDEDTISSDQLTIHNPNMARPGNQNNLKHGYYSEFVTTEDDAVRYANAENAKLRDELNLCRLQLAKVMITIRKLESDLNFDFPDMKLKLQVYEQLSSARSKFDAKVARIESIEVSLVRNLKGMAEIARAKAQTEKSKLEIKIMSKDSGDKTTPLAQVYSDILKMNDNGMLSGGYEDSLNITIDAEYTIVEDAETESA